MKKNYTKNLFTKSLLVGIFWLISFAVSAQCTITGATDVCENQTKVYSTTDTGTTYLWNATGGGTVIGTGTSVTVAWTIPGTGQVTLAIKDVLGNVISTCTKNITIHGLPLPKITPSFIAGCGFDTSKQGTVDKRDVECLVACDSTHIIYSTPMHAGSTYTWTVGGAAIWSSSTNTVNVYWTGVGAGTVKVKEVDIWGCEKEVEVCIQIVGKPKAKFITYPGLTGLNVYACKDQVIQFVNQSTAGVGSPILSYTWVFGDGATTVLPGTSNGNTSHAYALAGPYTAMLIVENECHCKDTAFISIIVNALPGPKIECVSTVCPGTTVTYTTNATGCTSYAWSVTNGTPIGSSTSSTFTVQWGSTGPGSITLAVNCGSFCNSPTTVFVPIISPSANITGPSRVCAYECYTYKLDCNIPIDSIKWTIPAGATFMSDSVNVHKITVCFPGAPFSGTISANYYHNTPGAVPSLSCGGSASKTVRVKPKMLLFGTTEICANDNYNFIISGGLPTSVYWTIHNSAGTLITSSTQAGNIAFSGTWAPIMGSGIFTITANDTNYCNSPQTILLKVNPIPPKLDSVTGPKRICPGYAYTYTAYTNNSKYTAAWSIIGGAPTSGVGSTISVVWNASGPYQVIAAQIDAVTGCKSDTIQYNVLSLLPLAASPITGNTTPCANSNQSYATTAIGTYFEWSISPSIAGSVNTGQYTNSVSIQWNNYTGPATITLTTFACGTSRTDAYNVTLTGVPTPVITAPLTACEGTAVTISSSGAATYSWNFGDGSPTAAGASNNHAFLSSGNKVITLTTTYGGSCPGTGMATKTIFVNPKPTVNISTPQLTQYCAGPVSNTFYTSAPVVAGITYKWFNGVTYTGVTTSTYSVTAVGTYFVVATNPITGCTDTSNKITLAIISCAPCKPDIPYTLDFTRFRLGCSKDSFVANGSAGVGSYDWNFDDPFNASTASGTPATHTYTEPGYYKVELCANVPSSTSSSGFCRECIYKVDTIKYIPDFIDSAYCINNADSVKTKFVNQTKILTGIATPTWSWSVSPGAYTSTAKDPIFNLAPNTYTITLTVGGVCSFVKTITINALPNASFTVVDSVCVGRPVVFNNTSTGVFNSSSWTFGDGANSLITSPIRSYSSAGLYNVVLTISNAFGCTDTALRSVRVLSNTLSTIVTPGGPTRFCEGDSVLLKQTPTGGYPGYTYLWTNVLQTKDIWANQTGTYFVSTTDSKGCVAISNTINVLVKSKPRPRILMDSNLCQNKLYNLVSNYPDVPGTVFDWYVDGTFWGNGAKPFYFASVLGPHTVIVNITSADTCMGTDTFKFVIRAAPNVAISSTGTLCAGAPNVLTATSTSVPFPSLLWSTGATTVSINASASQTYGVTATNIYGCQATAFKVVNPLPDLCGLMVGCYDICDTVTNLVWYAPKGYAQYQWYFNNVAIAWAVSDTFHVPLYQTGTYTVKITTSAGCSVTSDPINIRFINCGSCKFDITHNIKCDRISVAGNQMYALTFSINNSLGAGAGISISSPDGTVSSVSPGTLVAGVNTVTAIFEDIPPVTGTACFIIAIYTTLKKCDTTYCVRLPECPVEHCELITKVEKFECAGYDASGNPQYYVCLTVNWGGSNGSTFTLNAPSSLFTPNPVTINNGTQTICYTYTDLPPTTGFITIYGTAFDPATGKSCRDSVRQQYKPCPKDSCILEMYGYCATCKNQTATGQWTYGIDVTVFNPFGGNANVTILPIAAGTFGAITPNPIAAGMQMFSTTFTPNPSAGNIICFKVVLTDVATGKVCYKTICIALPPCDGTNISVAEFVDASISMYPNPAKDNVTIAYTFDNPLGALQFNVVDISGKKIASYSNPIDANAIQINTTNWNSGIYFINIMKDNQPVGTLKLVVVK